MLPPEAFASDEAKERLREQLGLNDPAPLRYLQWLRRTATGDLGYSLTSQKPITEVIAARLPATLLLVGFALVISIVIGVTHRHRRGNQAILLDRLPHDILLVFLALDPWLFLGLLMIYIFAVRLNWFPAFGATSPDAEYPVLDRLQHLILPGITLGLDLAAALTRYTRASLLEVLHADYIRTARAKGLPRAGRDRHGTG